MKGSPAICAENRVQRAQSTQRSRSSRISVEMATGFGNVRLGSRNRETDPPLAIDWFCSGHSPPLSQIGQSNGWLSSRNSSVPACAFFATGEVSWVRTTMSAVTVVVQEATGLRWPSTSTMHCRQAPTGSSSGWSQNRGISIPRSSAARMINIPFGTLTAMPSMVRVTRSGGAGSAGGCEALLFDTVVIVISELPRRRPAYRRRCRWRRSLRRRCGRRRSGRWRSALRSGRWARLGRTRPGRT